ncbi:hypothetical protein AB4Z01_35655, partial [Inquilinus sp. YAF38]|uniref:hypothetical protein n=1 Tax=Inquilinus sp. YAF38 TaxID=3233084 RepID=UPI003F91F84C
MERGADSDLDVQAHCRSLALQQIGMLTRIAEIGMRLVEAEGAKAIAQAERPETEQPEASRADAPAAVDHGLAFARHARTVQRALALRGRAATDLCARDKAQAADRAAAHQVRRDRHRGEVEDALRGMIWDQVEDQGRVDALHAELEERVQDLYDDEVSVEDRPPGSVMAGLACGLGLA